MFQFGPLSFHKLPFRLAIANGRLSDRSNNTRSLLFHGNAPPSPSALAVRQFPNAFAAMISDGMPRTHATA
jgi:hypothetical protein